MLQRTVKILTLVAAIVSSSLIFVSAETCHTYVNNLSSKSVHATTNYLAASSGFVNRVIAPQTQQGDEYSCALLDTHLEIWTDGAGDLDHTYGFFSADTSFVCIDNDDTGGIDVFISAYGQTSVPAKLWLSMPPLPPPADDDYGIFVLPDSDNDNIQLVTDPSITSNYPSLSNEASCTDNCLFKRSKDDVSAIATSSNLYRDFTDTVAMWDLDSSDRATGSTINILRNSNTRTGYQLRIDRQATNIQVGQNGQTYNYNLYAVQVGSDTLASVRVPTGYNIGARRIRNAFLESQRRAATTTILAPTTAPFQDQPTSVTLADNIRSLLWLLAGPLDAKIQL